jgi:hypothetical protein
MHAIQSLQFMAAAFCERFNNAIVFPLALESNTENGVRRMPQTPQRISGLYNPEPSRSLHYKFHIEACHSFRLESNPRVGPFHKPSGTAMKHRLPIAH